MDYLNRNNSLFIYNLINDEKQLKKSQSLLLEKRARTKELLDLFSDKYYENTIETVEDNKLKPPFTSGIITF